MNIFLSKYFIACVSEVFFILSELFRFFARIRFNEFVSLLNVAWVNEGFDLFDLILIIPLHTFCPLVTRSSGEFLLKPSHVASGEFNLVPKTFSRGKPLRTRLGRGRIKPEREVRSRDKRFGSYPETFASAILTTVQLLR